MKLAIFDLDNTLIAGDSDCLWGEYLCEQGFQDPEIYVRQHQQYYKDYVAGVLDIHDFLEFQLKPLKNVDPEILSVRRQEYLEQKVKPILLDKAINLIEEHRQKGHELIIITATNRFITEPIAELLGVHDLIASDAEIIDGIYTGKPVGIPSYAQGKVTRLKDWLKEHNKQPEETWFYSDSHNDIPLLKEVDHAIAVDPDEQLRAEAEKQAWPIISLR